VTQTTWERGTNLLQRGSAFNLKARENACPSMSAVVVVVVVVVEKQRVGTRNAMKAKQSKAKQVVTIKN
jgi:hypothetical protein